MSDRYVIYSAVPTQGIDENGAPITVAAHTVLNTVVWDGVSIFDPGPNLVLEQSDTLQPGDTVMS